MTRKILILFGFLSITFACFAQSNNMTSTRRSTPSNKEVTLTPSYSTDTAYKYMHSKNDTTIKEFKIKSNTPSEKQRLAIPSTNNDIKNKKTFNNSVYNNTSTRQTEPCNKAIIAIPDSIDSSSNSQ